jgi:small conductance mechanosensitive channel
VPNSAATGGNITNYTANGQIRLNIPAGIGYDDDLRAAKALFLDILRQHPLTLEQPEPTVVVSELGDNSVNFLLRPFCLPQNAPALKFDVTEQIKLRCDEAGISIPYPQRDVHLIQVATD